MRNSVLILDDVWEKIDMLKVGCTFSRECCRLIITTRSLEVCHRIGYETLIQVVKLRKEEAWKLFKQTLGKEMQLGPHVEEIAKLMAGVCDGLPLGIITLAGSMKGKMSIDTWKNALAQLKDGVGEVDEVFKVLKYNFDRLKRNDERESNTIQQCFMYCSLYPKDYAISRDDLVRKFISEGLLDERSCRRKQVEQGHAILDKLVNLCLLESCVNDDDEECVKMHDLIRGMALKIDEGKYMVRAGDESLVEIPHKEEWTKGLEKVSFMESGIRRIKDEISPNCSQLSTLVLSGNPLKVIPDSFFSAMPRLRTLDLCETHIKMLPDSICNINGLKSLLLENCYELESVPYLGKLKALRELNLSGTAIRQVPQGLEELLNLKFLSMDANGLKMLPRGVLLKLGQLEHVEFPLHIQVPIEEIENLKHLEEFAGGVKSVNDFNWFITSWMLNTYRIAVQAHHSVRYGKGEGSFGYYANELTLSGCNFQDDKVLGKGIWYLTIRKCEGLSMCFMDDFSKLDNPTSLKKLIIENCRGTECILSGEQGSQISTLEYIELLELEDLKRVIQNRDVGASAAFSSLRRLVIYKCNKIKKVGLPVSGVPNIEEINVEMCEEIEEIFEEDEGRTSVTLPNLKWLSLYDLPRLKSVSNATMKCKSISEIFIVNCPILVKKLPVHLQYPLPPTLQGPGAIKVEKEWWETLKWDNPTLLLLLQDFLYLY